MPETTKTIYVSIGNSDDRLSQAEWAHFYVEVDAAIDRTCTQVHGRWHSAGDSLWQNACWCVVTLDDQNELKLREALALAARAWRQDSIAWAEATTEFITPTEATNG